MKANLTAAWLDPESRKSIEEYTRLKRRDRRAIAVENLSDADIEAILLAEPPAEAAQYHHEFKAEDSANT